jgi:hypothetical protein
MFTRKMGSLCFLAACLVAASVYEYTGNLDLQAIYGAQCATMVSSCTDPCDNTLLKYYVECHDIGGGVCLDDECVLNTLRLIECTNGGEAGPCAHHNSGEWRRWIVVREHECNNQGSYVELYGWCKCSGAQTGINTPCKTDECTGTLVDDRAYPPLNREVCGAG